MSNLKNATKNIFRSYINSFIPPLYIYKDMFGSIKDSISSELIDFNRVVYDGENFHTDQIGDFAIKNKVHFTSNYPQVLKYELSFNKLDHRKSWRYNKFQNEKDGYTFYDPYLARLFYGP